MKVPIHTLTCNWLCRPHWPRGLRHVLSLTALALWSCVWITLWAWMCVRVSLCCALLCS